MRKLASIQTVDALTPIPGADAIEVAHVLGWKLVVNKGNFKVGDKCVYFEVDSYLPVDDKRYEFLRSSSYRNNEFMGEGFRIRTITLRGQLSQGLALPLSQFPELGDVNVGDDVSEALRVKKWDMPEVTGPVGTQKGLKPYGIPTTDETRVQSMDVLRTALLGKPYYISTKMDGTSCTIYCIHGEVGVCGRNFEYKDDGKSIMWDYFYRENIPERLKAYGKDIVLQGEFCGPTIQKNRIGLRTFTWYVFNVFDADMHLLPLDDALKICEELKLTHVPIEERGDSFNYTLDELLERARGKYELSGRPKEGIVIRPLTPEWSNDLGKALSFKVLNNDFLKKE